MSRSADSLGARRRGRAWLSCWLLALGVLWSVGCGAPLGAGGEPARQGIPITGTPVAGLAAYDDAMIGLLSRWPGVPGATLTVMKEGQLVLQRGYGLADREAQSPEAVEPDAL